MAIKAKESILDISPELIDTVNKLYQEINGILKKQSPDVIGLVLSTLYGDLLNYHNISEVIGSLEKARAFEEEYRKKVHPDKEALSMDRDRIKAIIQNEVMFAMASLHLEDNIRITVRQVLAEKTKQTYGERNPNPLNQNPFNPNPFNQCPLNHNPYNHNPYNHRG